MKVLRVRIKKASTPNLWYAESIGDILDVVEWDAFNYKLIIKNVFSRATYLIRKDDVEVVL